MAVQRDLYNRISNEGEVPPPPPPPCTDRVNVGGIVSFLLRFSCYLGVGSGEAGHGDMVRYKEEETEKSTPYTFFLFFIFIVFFVSGVNLMLHQKL